MKKNIIHSISILLYITSIVLVESCSKETQELTGPLPAEVAVLKTKGLHVGTAVVDITPENPININLEGYGGTGRTSTGVHDPLTARCLFLYNEKTAVVIVSLDLIGVFKKHIEDMKKMIARETGLKNENIFIHSIHSHSGPEMLGDDSKNKRYRSQLYRNVTDCILKAIKSGKKATAVISLGNSQVKTVNRRDPAKQVTNPFTTIEFLDSAKQNISTLLNFGCHPVVLGPDNYKISADYVYYLRNKIETSKGGVAIFVNSRFGDINPPSMIGENAYNRSGGTFEMAQALGEQLAIDMLQLTSVKDTLSISISTVTKTIGNLSGKFTQISILNLGQVQIAMIPGEPLEGFDEKIEALLPGPYKMSMGQTGDAIGYIIPEEEWNKCNNSFIQSCYEETISAGVTTAGKLEAGYIELTK